MWSLPDLKRLNAEAESKFFKRVIKRAVNQHLDSQGNPIHCDYCSNEAESVEPYFDIFSNDAKGVITLCEDHEHDYGSTPEGYFYCDGCDRLFIENYTWELYYHAGEDGQHCLNCYRWSALQDSDNWMNLTEQEIQQMDFDRIRKAKHLIAVGQGPPKERKFIGNVEFDSASGGRLTGYSSCERTPDGSVRDIQNLLEQARDQGYQRAILILNAAYQFSVSVGVYVNVSPTSARRFK